MTSEQPSLNNNNNMTDTNVPISSSPAAAASSSSHSSSSSSSSSSDSLTNQLLDDFLNWNTTIQLYCDAVGKFLTLQKDYRNAASQLTKFQSTSSRHAPRVTLPKSLSLKFTKSILFKPVPDQPDFYKQYTDQLTKLENDTTQSIVTIITAAKQAHLDTLRSNLNPISFISQQVNSYTPHVTEYEKRIRELTTIKPASSSSTADSTSAAAAASSSTSLSAPSHTVFPTQRAISHFESMLHTRINELVSGQIQTDIDAESTAAAQTAASNSAKEDIMVGAHTRETLHNLAKRTVEKAIAPIQRTLTGLRHQRSMEATSAADSAITDSSSRHRREKPGVASNSTAASSSSSHNAPPSISKKHHSSSRSDLTVYKLDPASVTSSRLPNSNRRKKRRHDSDTASTVSNNHNDTPEHDENAMEDVSVTSDSRSNSTNYRGGAPRNTHRSQAAKKSKHQHHQSLPTREDE